MKRRKTKSLAKLKKDLQKIFNKYIRYRDTDGIGGCCISCGKWYKFEDLQAGHYYAVSGYDGLRFDEFNVRAECKGCNCFDHSHLIGYGINLKEVIGEEELEKLHERAREYKKNGYRFTRLEIQEMINFYKERLKDYENH